MNAVSSKGSTIQASWFLRVRNPFDIAEARLPSGNIARGHGMPATCEHDALASGQLREKNLGKQNDLVKEFCRWRKTRG